MTLKPDTVSFSSTLSSKWIKGFFCKIYKTWFKNNRREDIKNASLSIPNRKFHYVFLFTSRALSMPSLCAACHAALNESETSYQHSIIYIVSLVQSCYNTTKTSKLQRNQDTLFEIASPHDTRDESAVTRWSEQPLADQIRQHVRAERHHQKLTRRWRHDQTQKRN